MKALSAADILELCERGAGLHSIDRALLVLCAADPECERDALARLPLGTRDAHLLSVRRLTLGNHLDAEAQCPLCDERLDFALDCSALLERALPAPAEWTIESNACRLTIRPLDSRDAAAAAQCMSLEAARDTLLARSVVALTRDGEELAVDALPESVRDALAASLSANDPGAEWLLDLACPACGYSSQSVFDVADFVWREIEARGAQLLTEVHALAGAYGWREAEILALSPARRAAYISLLG